ncbi:MAG TPA: hypothetical protein VKX96_08220 [Chloroflexota bacterium]|jgi:hypothetical protein|nr:hypothetical protein [Chloroflexota bacterium]
MDEVDRFALARLRNELREVDAEIDRIKREDRLFRRYRFGSDFHDSQIIALQAQRQEILAKLRARRAGTKRSISSPAGLRAWLLWPAALVAAVFTGGAPRRRLPRSA